MTRAMITALALFSTLSFAGPTRADLMFNITPTTYFTNTTNDFFEVYLINNGPSVVVNSFSFELTTNDDQIDFLNATLNTSPDAYIFTGRSFTKNVLGTDDITASVSAQSLTAGDLYDTLNQGVTLQTGEVVGLGEVFFNLGGGPPRTITIGFVNDGTSLADPDGTPITNFTVNPGSITVVPEPGPLALGLSAAAALGVRQLKRRGRLCARPA
jgi:hypothetical protein